MLFHRITRLCPLILLIFVTIYSGPFKIKVILSSDSSNESEPIIDKRDMTKSVNAKINLTSKTVTRNEIQKLTLPLPFKYLINPHELCSKEKSRENKLKLLILVCTAVTNVRQREAIRTTWGSAAAASNNTDSVRLGFLLGSTENASLQREIELESARYADVIQQDFVDSYQNLTLKSIMLLKWVSEYCPNVEYVLKTDDDMYINVPNLIETLFKLPNESNAIYGTLFRNARPNRNPSDKWYVPKDQFEGDVFPNYLSGTAYLMSREVVPKLYEASGSVPFLVMEDVFITGLCASKCYVKRLILRGFTYKKRSPTGCSFKDAITGHHVTISDMKRIWKELFRKPLKCPLKKEEMNKNSLTRKH